MCPLDDQHIGIGEIHIVIPPGVLRAAHALEPDVVRPIVEGLQNGAELFIILLGIGTQVLLKRRPTSLLVGGEPGVFRGQLGFRIRLLLPQLRQNFLYGIGIHTAVHQAPQACRPENADALRVVVHRNSSGVVVTGQGIAAHTGAAEIMAQQGGNLRLSDTGAAADCNDDSPVNGHLGRHRYQLRENGVGFCNMFWPDLDLVPGHVPMGDVLTDSRGLPGAQGSSQIFQRVLVHL